MSTPHEDAPQKATPENTDHEAYERQLEEAMSHERAYVDRLYTRLDELREENREKLADVRRTGSAGSHQNRSERDAYATFYEDRLAQLDAVDNRLVFGRLDLDDESTRYIGRIGLADQNHERLMVDWRAPEAGTFYQATAFERQGVQRRRHLILDRRTLKNIEDDVLDPEFLDNEEVLHGEGALLAALNRKRTGRMNDIVATIQAEQDRIIRADLAGIRVVQGGPGTGKTAVALHRAAYLLYTNRERLQKSGVLVVGPSSSFMWYIERVLPSLGETGVVMSSLATLYPGIRAVPETNPRVARIKGALDMAKVVKKAVADRQKVPQQIQELYVDSSKVQLRPRQVKHARERARATGKPHNQARETFVKILVQDLADQLEKQLNESSGNDMDRSYLVEDVRQSRDVRVALNLAWMPMTAEMLVRDLFSKRHYLESAASHLTSEEIGALLRPKDAPFTEADVPLLDEAAELLGDFEAAVGQSAARAAAERNFNLENATKTLENVDAALEDMGVNGVVTAEMLAGYNEVGTTRMTAAEAANSDRTWAYGHVVVDEAQELSPMQWRLLMRRCPMKSFTIVGDIAQASAAASSSSWHEALEPFAGDRYTLDELTVNYRTPSQISDAAASMAQAAGLDVSAPRAVREGQWSPEVIRTDDVLGVLKRRLRQDLSAVAGGLVGVIVAEPDYERVVKAVTEEFSDLTGTSETALERQILVLTPWEAKGLEFDTVVIAEPGAMVDSTYGTVGDLYVSMTRPTQRLTLIASHDVPAGLEEWTTDSLSS
ncbi:HelD family protein [Rothia uropygialis]|uniref:HelD family protein n=1 Tax=Kocuria sp. 36 TaxID=1415402 RepID=UPI00101E10B2|nr:AAA family ATPase [Kocuria sp. 36]